MGIKKIDIKNGITKFRDSIPKLTKMGRVIGSIILAGGIAVGSALGHNALAKNNNLTSSKPNNKIEQTIPPSHALYRQNLTRFEEFKILFEEIYERLIREYTFIEIAEIEDITSMEDSQVLRLLNSVEMFIYIMVYDGQYGNVSPEALAAINGGLETSIAFIYENDIDNGCSLLDFMTVGQYALCSMERAGLIISEQFVMFRDVYEGKKKMVYSETPFTKR